MKSMKWMPVLPVVRVAEAEEGLKDLEHAIQTVFAKISGTVQLTL